MASVTETKSLLGQGVELGNIEYIPQIMHVLLSAANATGAPARS